jgi:hypothetical protein
MFYAEFSDTCIRQQLCPDQSGANLLFHILHRCLGVFHLFNVDEIFKYLHYLTINRLTKNLESMSNCTHLLQFYNSLIYRTSLDGLEILASIAMKTHEKIREPIYSDLHFRFYDLCLLATEITTSDRIEY